MDILNKRTEWLDSANSKYFSSEPTISIDSVRFIKHDTLNTVIKAVFLVYSHQGKKSRKDTAEFDLDNNDNLIDDVK